MKSKHRKTLIAIFATPTRANIKFSDIESLVIALGGEVREGAGSRVMLEISGKREYAHRPHPGKEAKRYIVERIRKWLINLEVTP
ncbi:type II toxin-antitoxin system HicA family toxin [Desulfobacter latus]|uniref:Type II toxin-antitoxin system HicA family toxin n=1 Tax=Desulfobacter latus TaxID=2292 RepID=A0A850SZK8_9BACT|nr:type II toxin-antitoxin system HicA family toxin [Desulfobacter latus]